MLFALLFFVCMYITLQVKFYNDDFTYGAIASKSFSEILEFMRWHTQHINGRVIVHLADITFLKNSIAKIIWCVLCSAGICGLCAAVPRIASQNNEATAAGYFMSVLLFMGELPRMWSLSVYWITGSFNYFFPIVLFVLLVLLVEKEKSNVAVVLLAALCGVLSEQVGMMTVGLFFLLIANELIRKKKLKAVYAVCFVLSLAGVIFLTVSGGVKNRMDYQGGLTAGEVLSNLLLIIKLNWTDNMFITLFSLVMTACILFWLYRFKDDYRFIGAIRIPATVVLLICTAVNLMLKAVKAYSYVGGAIVLPDMVSKLLLAGWTVYAVLLISLLIITSVLIYIKLQNTFVPMLIILGFGSQFMMMLYKEIVYRTCISGFVCFMVYIVFTAEYVFENYLAKKEKSHVYRRVFAAVCICACLAHAAVSPIFLRSELPSISIEEGDTLTDIENKMVESCRSWYTSDEFTEKNNLLDFTNNY